MARFLPLFVGSASAAFFGSAASAAKVAGGAYSFSARKLEDNTPQELSQYKGQVSLVVNVASK